MKKILVSLITILCLAGLSACGDRNEQNTNDDAQATEQAMPEPSKDNNQDTQPSPAESEPSQPESDSPAE